MVYLTSIGSGTVITSAILTTPQINDTSLDHQYIVGVSELVADRTVTLPLLTGNDTFVFEEHIQTLTNKTLSSATMGTDLAMGGFTLTGMKTPSLDGDAATKAYVDSVAAGLSVKSSVVAATTAAGTLASDFEDTDVIDGVTLATGDRILIKNQSTGSENGIYIVAASGAPTRASDMASTVTAAGFFVFVTEGTVNADSGFVCTSDAGADVVGTDALAFTQFSGAGQITASTGLTKAGNTLSIDTSITADLTTTQTLTNKSINIANNTVTGAMADFATALTDGLFNMSVVASVTAADVGNGTSTWAAMDTIYPMDTTAAREVFLPAISATNDGQRITIADFTGTAATFNITVTPETADYIGNQTVANTSDTIAANYNTITMVAVYNGGTTPRWVYI